ncbi:3-hydroxybutyryl-CoA dehydrogenase [Clostridium sediminicola]|uniref:3-hydroxyacyl-CoA dehydrogenase family protein n=1 Tax=Clostridium sediminicola TaxID=3114879 RepID=UPI0031F2598C
MNIDWIKKIGVAGAGTMGASIAECFARSGYEVVLYDLAEEYLKRGKTIIEINNNSLIKEDIITEKEAEESFNRINFTTDKKVLADCDFITESIIEKIEIKQEFWRELSSMVKEGTILTSNTSGLSITEISRDIPQKNLFAGFHWVNPPHIVPLVEIIKGDGTSDETAQLIKEVSIKINKKPVLVNKDTDGFVLNRIQFAVFREALNIVEKGIATVEDVDAVLKYGLGFRYAFLGPFETADLGGLDTFYYISSYLFNELSSATKPSPILKELIDNNHFGSKTGKGFYDYSNGREKEIMERRDQSFLKMIKHIYNAQ